MFTFIKKVIKTGTPTSRYPLEPMPVDKTSAASRSTTRSSASAVRSLHVNACPSNALTVETDLKTGELARQF